MTVELLAEVDSDQALVPVSSPEELRLDGVYSIESERVIVRSRATDGGKVLLARGAFGTQRASHQKHATIVEADVFRTPVSIPAEPVVQDVVDALVALGLATQVAVSYPELVVADGATHYWRLGESSGLVAADSIGSADGSYENGVALGLSALIESPDTSIELDGGTQYVNVPDDPDLDQGSGPLSWEVWFRMINLSDRQVLMGKGNGAPALAFRLNSSTNQIFWFVEAVANKVRTLTQINDSLRHHVVGTKESGGGDVWKIYLDGVDDTEIEGGPGAEDTTSTSDPLQFGQYVNGDYSLHGGLDEVAIYDRVLTPEEVAAHYALGVGA